MGFHETTISPGSRELATPPDRGFVERPDPLSLEARILTDQDTYMNAALSMLERAASAKENGLSKENSGYLEQVAFARAFLASLPSDQLSLKGIIASVEKHPKYVEQFGGLCPEVIVVFTELIHKIDKAKKEHAIKPIAPPADLSSPLRAQAA